MRGKIAVFSDIHDKTQNLQWLLDQLTLLEPAAMICCGDLSSPETLEILASQSIPLHFCLGNTDEMAAQAMMQISLAHPLVYFGGRQGQFVFKGKKATFTHYPEVAQTLAAQGTWDAVFFGHSHRRHMEKIGACLLANPGDIQNRHGDGPSLLLWDPAAHTAEFIISGEQKNDAL